MALICLTSLGFEWEGHLSRLRRELSTADAARRREVVRLLGSYSARDAGEAILTALADSDAGVRAEAADSAGRVRLRSAVPHLLDWLDEADADVRASAARALGNIGDPRTVTPLVRALGDSNGDVRRAAVVALAVIGTDDVVVPLLGRLDDSDATVRIESAEALGQLGDPRAVVPLVGRARDDSPEVRVAVYGALGELRDRRANAALLQGLSDAAEQPQLAAIAALGRLGSDAAVEPLSAMLENPDARRTRAVVAALGAIGGEEALGAVIDALGRHDTRAVAAEVLLSQARRGPGPIMPMLARAITDAATDLQVTAIAEVIHRIGLSRPDPRATASLLDILHAGRGAPSAVLRALATTGSADALVPILEHLRSDSPGMPGAALDALDLYFTQMPPDGRAADPLLAALGQVPQAERIRVVRLLGVVRAARALPALRPLVEHEDAALRLAAVEAIGRIGDAEGAPLLIDLLSDRDRRTRWEAARALGAAASADTLRLLLRHLRDPEPFDRHSVVLALAGALPRLRASEALPADVAATARRDLLAAARGPDEALAERAIDALGRWAAPQLGADLAELTGPSVPAARRRAAVAALGPIDSDVARAALRRGLRSRDVALLTTAAVALGEHGVRADAAPLLRVGRRGPWPASAAASFALARMARRGVLEARPSLAGLCALAESHDPFVRANVAMAFAALGAGPCTDGADPDRWLGARHAAVVRVAAARWLHAAAEAGHIDAPAARERLDQCAARDLSPEVVGVCSSPGLPALGDEADVYAYTTDGDALLTNRLVALRLADGTVLVSYTDVNGHLRLLDAPEGPLVLEDPTSVPLEP